VLNVADGIMMMPVLAFRAQLPPLKTRHKECLKVFETDCREIPQRMKFFSQNVEKLFHAAAAAATSGGSGNVEPTAQRPQAERGCAASVLNAGSSFPPTQGGLNVQRLA